VDRVVLVYTKPPIAGRVKTRLVGALGPQGAADLHAALLLDLLDGLEGGAFRVELRWLLAEGEQPPELGPPWAAQEGGDLGERLWSGLSGAAAGGSLVAAVGSDHPDLPRERAEAAFAELERGADVVLGPASDGGYYLIALRPASVQPEVFVGIPWSTPQVYAATTARCRSLGLRVETLPEAADVDTPEDLVQLAARLSTASPGCPRTRSLLARWGWGSAA
jgi:hypothetical protein